MTANIVLVLVFDSGARNVPGRLLSVGFSGFYGAERRNQNAEPGPRAAVVMATGAVTVKEARLLRYLRAEVTLLRLASRAGARGPSKPRKVIP
jgi:hypothetical protein